ncbi:MAG: hypothetical protein DRG76_09490 [Deltaproteobacteria bacterium]|nr:MAG: hypothetical protein DRG76_09490 [Deltaproteobacteria bacterium]
MRPLGVLKMDTASIYSQWREINSEFLGQLRGKQIFLLFSGGKDSSVGMDLIMRARSEYDFSLQAHGGAYPVHRYTKSDLQRIRAYWEAKGAQIVWHKIDQTDTQLNSAEDPCKVCQRLRKEKLNKVLKSEIRDWTKLVLVVCYSLSDLASYAVEHILGAFSGQKDLSPEGSERAMETAQRFYPFLVMKEGYVVFRPLLTLDSRTIYEYLDQMGIPTLSIPCRYRNFRPKRLLEEYYEKMALRFDYEQLFDFMKQIKDFPLGNTFTSMDKEKYLSKIF